MPNMDGFQFLGVVRQRFSQLPVIVFSGAFGAADVPSSVLADAFFEKSHYTPDQLIARVADLVRKPPTHPPVGKPTASVGVPRGEKSDVA
jgi:CheY-like chemotaxis protein